MNVIGFVIISPPVYPAFTEPVPFGRWPDSCCFSTALVSDSINDMSVKTCTSPAIAVWALNGDGISKLRAMIITFITRFLIKPMDGTGFDMWV